MSNEIYERFNLPFSSPGQVWYIFSY